MALISCTCEPRRVDSPLIAGEHFKTIDLTPGQKPPHYLHIVGDTPATVEMKPDDVAQVIDFDSRVQVVQPFTSNQAALQAAIALEESHDEEAPDTVPREGLGLRQRALPFIEMLPQGNGPSRRHRSPRRQS